MDKYDYFPTKRLFEESQDLVATFYSTGDYISETSSDYATMLSQEDIKDDFYYALYLLSMLSNTGSIIKLIEQIIKGLNSFRVKRKVTSTEDFLGDIDIEKYIERNYIEKVSPKEYPSIIKYSSFQMPEYQLTLYIAMSIESIYRELFRVLGSHDKVTAFKIAHKHCDHIRKDILVLKRKYGIDFRRKESYYSLKKKVIYRYRNRKIIDDKFKRLILLYERMLHFKGIDFDTSESLDILDHTNFEDRLYEIWLIRKSTEYLADYLGIPKTDLVYLPLFKARKNNTAITTIETPDFRIEILFQNRKNFMPKKDLKWYFLTDSGAQEEIGAIPDLVFIKYLAGHNNPERIVLVDAKNRPWTLNNMEPIKSEVVQQIYIHDNFISLFGDYYCSMLIAHNNESLQTRRFYHKDHSEYEIDVISMDMKDEVELNNSLDKYVQDLKEYLQI